MIPAIIPKSMPVLFVCNESHGGILRIDKPASRCKCQYKHVVQFTYP